MSITDAPVEIVRQPNAEALARQIGVECDRALRRLDGLVSERDDVLLAHTRTFVARVARLSALIVRHQTGG